MERRTPLLPEHAMRLMARGHRVSVERSPLRCVRDDEYAAAGCQLVDEGSWAQAAPVDAVILGLKELPGGTSQFPHDHIYFAHAYKNQVRNEVSTCAQRDG